MCTTCGHTQPGAGQGGYHPYAFCRLVKQLGGFSAEANLAAVIRDARSDDPRMKAHVDAFLEQASTPAPSVI